MRPIYHSVIGPTLTQDATLTIAAPGVGKRNSLTYIVVESTAAGDVTIASGTNKAIFAIVANTPFFKRWPLGMPLRGNENTTLTISVSGGGNYNITHGGFVQ